MIVVMVIDFKKNLAAACSIAALGGLLSGCSTVGGITGSPTPDFGPPISQGAPTSPVESSPLQGSAEQIGSGPVRIGLIAPLTPEGGNGGVGRVLRNAVELAYADSGANAVTILVKDDQSTPAGARAAAQSAINEGAEIILGPLFAGNVREVGAVARAAGKPVIAFSTDATAASRGVNLLSFLVESYVDRIVDFAAARGKRSMAALIPQNTYGNIAEAAFQEAAARKGVRVVAIEKYSGADMGAAVQRIAAAASGIDALFIPEQAEQMAGLSRALIASGIDPKRVQILGTGVWSDARVLKLPALQGAWYAAPDNSGFNAFASRYRAKFNSDPTRLATLAYDAASLALALARQQGSQRFSESVLTNPSGFNGADGVFRFLADGRNERGLAVQQINNGSTSIVSPAPRSFGAGGT